MARHDEVCSFLGVRRILANGGEALMLEDEGVIGGVIDDQRGINGAVMDDQRVVVVVGCSDNCPNEHGGGGTSAKELSAIKQSQRTSLVD